MLETYGTEVFLAPLHCMGLAVHLLPQRLLPPAVLLCEVHPCVCCALPAVCFTACFLNFPSVHHL